MGRNKTATILLFYFIVTIFTAILLAPLSWPIGLAIWVILDLVLLFAIVAWHARVTLYTCPNCGNVFSVSAVTDLVSPHGTQGGGWKYLRCPRCMKMVKASPNERQQRSRQ